MFLGQESYSYYIVANSPARSMEAATQFQVNYKSLDEKVVTALEKLGEIFRVMLWNITKETGLSPIQIQILIFINTHQESFRRVAHLAREFNLTKATISDAVRVLEEKHLISKLPDPNDARSQILKLTITGEKIANELSRFSDPLVAVLKNLDPTVKANFYSTSLNLLNQLAEDKIINHHRVCFSCSFFESQPSGNTCNFLKKDLTPEELEVDCPFYVPN